MNIVLHTVSFRTIEQESVHMWFVLGMVHKHAQEEHVGGQYGCGGCCEKD